ncbi:50S ribosomal protein L18 [Patescibacteria group bacterium]
MTKIKEIINPTIVISKSLKYIHAQVINARDGRVLAQISDRNVSEKTKTLRAKKIGQRLADILKKMNIKKITYTRNSNKYCGRIQALIESIRSEGVKI